MAPGSAPGAIAVFGGVTSLPVGAPRSTEGPATAASHQHLVAALVLRCVPTTYGLRQDSDAFRAQSIRGAKPWSLR